MNSAENLDGMTSEQLMLRDFLYELHDLLRSAQREPVEYRQGVYAVAAMLQSYLKAFDVDQSRFARPMPDVDAWFVGKAP